MTKETDWQPIDTAPKDGREIIAWLSSDKGFQDCTATLEWNSNSKEWFWTLSNLPVKRQDLIKGWMPYPEPPTNNLKETK